MIASGNHLLTQVKDNQPTLRRKLELGAKGRKPGGCATSKAKGPNRWETRELTVFPVKAWFRHTPWEKLIRTVLRVERTVCKLDPKTGVCATTTETVFWVSSAEGIAPERWKEWIRDHWRIENGCHYVRDVAFAEDASRIRKNPDIAARLRSFAYNLIRASGAENIKNARYRAALDISFALKLLQIHRELNSPGAQRLKTPRRLASLGKPYSRHVDSGLRLVQIPPSRAQISKQVTSLRYP